MLFNSVAFGIFLPIVFLLYWILRKRSLRLQNIFLITVSYVFYGWWDWRFLSLIIVSSTIDYIVGLRLGRTTDTAKRKLLLGVSLFANLGLLGFFKYFDFFVTSFCEMLGDIGLHASPHSLNIILPIGISFYTFQTLSYTIDIYRKQIKPTEDLPAFFAFVSFFPQLVAGPIERAHNLLPQFLKRRVFTSEKAAEGLRQMLNGFIKKLLIADNLALTVDSIFANYNQYNGITLLLGVFFFAMQIYCDFSGYSDIAIGTAKLFGFDLMRNFAYPYFSRDISEFWRRWHISLSTWFRDYLYVPLCGSRPSRYEKARNIIITFVLCGLWHGAGRTFVIWGALMGIYLLPTTIFRRQRHIGTPAEGRLLPTFHEAVSMLSTFLLVLLAWVFFRSQNLSDAYCYILRMLSPPYFHITYMLPYKLMLGVSILLLVLEWIQREKQFMLQIGNLPVTARWAIYYLCAILLLVFGATGNREFIYFQF